MEYISYNAKTETINRHATRQDAISQLKQQIGGASHHELSMSYIAKVIPTSVIPTGTCDSFGMKSYTIELRHGAAISSNIAIWFKECVVWSSKNTMAVSEVYDHYIDWCIRNNVLARATKRALSEFLIDAGVSKSRTSTSRIWNGISLK